MVWNSKKCSYHALAVSLLWFTGANKVIDFSFKNSFTVKNLLKGDWLRPAPWKYLDGAEWNIESTPGISVSLQELIH